MSNIYYPLDPKLVTEWPGPRDGGSWWHYGTDFGVPVNTALKACFDGEIVFAGGDGAAGVMNGVVANGQGLTVDIRRSDGLIARYGHMNRIDVRVGQRVKAGGYIGLSGNTGFTTGPHCHWELRWDRAWSGGAWVDPRPLKPKTFGASSKPAAKPATILEEDTDMIFIRTSTAGAVYAWNPLTRKASAKGYSKDEWEAIKDAYAASNGRGAPIVTVTPAVFKSMTGRNA